HFWIQPGGRTRYNADHINIWADSVDGHLTLDHELACVTDQPEGIDPRVRIIDPPGDFDNVRIPTWNESLPQCLRRISMFRPDAAEVFGSERFVNMDLDCVIGGSLDPLFDRPEDIVLYRGTHRYRPYNGSMVMMTAGARPQVFERFTPQNAAKAGEVYPGSDQAWISYVLGWGEATWTAADGVVSWNAARPDYDKETTRLLFFPCPTKPWELVAAGEDEWIAQNYRRTKPGWCLILGHHETVWTDAEAALDARDYDAVIASPEAA